MGRLIWAKCKIKRVFLAKGFPLTPDPPDPSPQKFGVSLIKLNSVFVRIYGERGASMEQRDSEVRDAKAGSPRNEAFGFGQQIIECKHDAITNTSPHKRN